MPLSGALGRPKAPKHLRTTTRKWFENVIDEYDLEPSDIRLLTLAGEAWDRGQQAREVVDRDGMTFTDRFGQPKARPEIGIERDSRIGFARLLRELSLDVGEPDSRPPGLARNGG